MINFSSMSIHGLFSYGRARVLWKDGMLRAYSPDRLLFELRTEKPVRLQGYLNRWSVENDVGELTLKGKCMTCGGPRWWRLMRMPEDLLWAKL